MPFVAQAAIAGRAVSRLISIRLEARGCFERCSDGRCSEQEYECEIERERERERDMATSAFVVTTAVCLHVLVFV